MEKVLQEFRIIETDDGFRIEIKGDKEQLRDFVMNLDPRRWMHGEHHGPHGGSHEWGPFPFGPRFKMRFRHGGRGFGPFGSMWGWDDEDDDEHDRPRRKRGQGHGRKRGHRRHQHDDPHYQESDTDTV